MTALPCPDVILKNWLPTGGLTVTESAIDPASLIVKESVSVSVLLDRLILLNSRFFGVTTSLLAAALTLAPPPVTWA